MQLSTIMQQFWQRTGTTVSPLTSSDNIKTLGDIYVYGPAGVNYGLLNHDNVDFMIGTNAFGMQLRPFTDLTVVLGDAAGAKKFYVCDSTETGVAYIDSDGNLYAAGDIMTIDSVIISNATGLDYMVLKVISNVPTISVKRDGVALDADLLEFASNLVTSNGNIKANLGVTIRSGQKLIFDGA